MSWAAKQPCKNSLSKLTLLMLANYADSHHKTYPSYATLAKMCECNERSVMRAIKLLEQDGLIKIQKRFTDEGKQTRDKQNINNNKRGDKYDSLFQEWWNLYPRREGSKSRAYELWKKVTSKDITVSDLLEATRKFQKSQLANDKKFIPHATTWLGQRRWETVQELANIKTTKNNLAG
jgi:DNA-binding transcriptional regulator YhcF (GntR family)